MLIYCYFITPCYSQDAITIQKGTQAPFTGILLPSDKAEDMKNAIIERDGLKKMNDSLKLSIDLQDDLINRKDNQIKVVLEQNDVLSKADKSTNTLEKGLWFSGGALAVILLLYGVKNAAK